MIPLDLSITFLLAKLIITIFIEYDWHMYDLDKSL
jgi:hypothetical protein